MSMTTLRPTISKPRQLGPFHSQVTVEPLERGFGHTLGNALRRVMMSSIPGFAATEVKIAGVAHEYDRVEGMREDVIVLLLNIKNAVFKLNNNSTREVARVRKEGPGPVLAGDIQQTQNLEVVNPDCILATLAKGGKLDMEIVVESGVGYQPAAAMERASLADAIRIDASFCPVKRMSFSVGSARHESRVDLDRLVMEIESNGVNSCEEMIRHASRILINQFKVFANVDDDEEESAMSAASRQHDPVRAALLSQSVDLLELTVRPRNCLKSINIRYIGELVQQNEQELMRKTAHLGKKSLLEIQQALGKHSLTMGMEMPNWKAPK